MVGLRKYVDSSHAAFSLSNLATKILHLQKDNIRLTLSTCPNQTRDRQNKNEDKRRPNHEHKNSEW